MSWPTCHREASIVHAYCQTHTLIPSQPIPAKESFHDDQPLYLSTSIRPQVWDCLRASKMGSTSAQRLQDLGTNKASVNNSQHSNVGHDGLEGCSPCSCALGIHSPISVQCCPCPCSQTQPSWDQLYSTAPDISTGNLASRQCCITWTYHEDNVCVINL